MRDYLNSILSFIGAESLTDDEFATIDPDLDVDDDEAVYAELKEVLESRDNISTTLTRLDNYFLAKGLELPESDSSKSQIYIGSALCD